jgi:OmpA-OmpF porin, OOP family
MTQCKNHYRGRALLILGAALLATTAQAQDIAGARDHPAIRRVPGSTIREYNVDPRGRCILPLGPARGDSFTESRVAEGKVTRIFYAQREGMSIADVYREFERAFREAGVRSLFTCTDESCGSGSGDPAGCSARWVGRNGQRHFTGSTGEGSHRALISLHVQAPAHRDAPVAVLTVIEPPEPNDGVGSGIPTPAMNPLASRGFVDLEGPLFETGSARLQDRADPVLRQVAAYLKQNPGVRLFVVNHTNNEGNWQREMELSKARAQAVVQALVSRHGIAANRLSAQGVGPLAPVADVRTDAGRSRNTRTTLVVRE